MCGDKTSICVYIENKAINFDEFGRYIFQLRLFHGHNDANLSEMRFDELIEKVNVQWPLNSPNNYSWSSYNPIECVFEHAIQDTCTVGIEVFFHKWTKLDPMKVEQKLSFEGMMQEFNGFVNPLHYIYGGKKE